MDFCYDVNSLELKDLVELEQNLSSENLVSIQDKGTKTCTRSVIILSLQLLISCFYRTDTISRQTILHKVLLQLQEERADDEVNLQGKHLSFILLLVKIGAGEIPIALTKYNVVDIATLFQEHTGEADSYDTCTHATPVPSLSKRELMREFNATKKLMNRTRPRLYDLSDSGSFNWQGELRSSGTKCTRQERRRSKSSDRKQRSRSVPSSKRVPRAPKGENTIQYRC